MTKTNTVTSRVDQQCQKITKAAKL